MSHSPIRSLKRLCTWSQVRDRDRLPSIPETTTSKSDPIPEPPAVTKPSQGKTAKQPNTAKPQTDAPPTTDSKPVKPTKTSAATPQKADPKQLKGATTQAEGKPSDARLTAGGGVGGGSEGVACQGDVPQTEYACGKAQCPLDEVAYGSTCITWDVNVMPYTSSGGGGCLSWSSRPGR
jgi:hypothetical protein